MKKNKSLDLLEQGEALRSTATTDRWFLVLDQLSRARRRVLFGGRLSPSEWVENIIETSEDPPTSRLVFSSALQKWVEQWQPKISDPVAGPLVVVEVIAAFTPPWGYLKLAKLFVKMQGLSRPRRRSRYGLMKSILFAFRSYFPVPPAAAKSDGYRRFCKILTSCLADPNLAADAAGMLLDLGALDLREPRLKDLISENTKVVRALFLTIQQKPDEAVKAEEARLLLLQALKASEDAYNAFVGAAEDQGYLLVESASAISLRRSGSSLEISLLDEEAEAKYFALRAGRTRARWQLLEAQVLDEVAG